MNKDYHSWTRHNWWRFEYYLAKRSDPIGFYRIFRTAVLVHHAEYWRRSQRIGLHAIGHKKLRFTWHPKTRVPELPCDACLRDNIIFNVVLIEHRLVTDRQTDRHSRYVASIASPGKNCMHRYSKYMRLRNTRTKMYAGRVACPW